uniref:WD repeat-containing protein 19 n=1 Tax=Eptatretus burgeri TaxID=7764 RepID=A0A8C4PW69_EPTBU
MTFLIWAKTIPVLAVGTAKGNLLLYNQQTSRKIHILGKHNNKITCGAWSSQNLLALGSDDNTLSISDLEGVTLLQKSICGNLREMHFSTMKTNDQSEEGEKTVSLLAGKKTLILLNIDCPDDPIELAFQQNYGSIVCHHWYGDGYIIIGFSLGDLVVISTHPQEIGREIFHCHDHNGSLISVAVTEVIGKVATCGNNCIKIHDLAKMNEIDHVITLDSEPKGLGELQWVADGHLLAVATQRGALHVFLARLPQLGAACGTRIAHLTSLREVTICSPVEEEPSLTLEIDIEPSIIGAGPDHVAVCLNNRVWFYAILENGNVQPLKEQEYNGTVKAVSLNDKYAAVAFEGKVQLHTIEDSIISASWEHKTLLLPVRENVGLITSHALTPEFLIYATDVKKTKVEIPNVSSMHGILWDIALSSRTIFVAFNKENVFTYAFHKNAIMGPRVILAGSSKLQFNHNPLLLYNGELTCQAESTHLDSVILKSHPFLEVQKVNSASKVELSHMFTQSLMLLRFADTWPICERLQLQSNWNHFAQAAIYHGELDIASQVYRRMGDAAMVLALQDAKVWGQDNDVRNF